MDGERVGELTRRRSLNPFADADDSDEEEGDGSFEIGELEDEVEGLRGNGRDTQVGGPDPALAGDFPLGVQQPRSPGSPPGGAVANVGMGLGRAAFPSLWPFGSPTSLSRHHDGETVHTGFMGYGYGYGKLYANDLDEQSIRSNHSSDSEEANSSDEEFGGVNGEHEKSERRLSSTTEAKRRTSLEDEDSDGDEGVVHVKMAEADIEEAEGKGEGEGEGELVEMHVEEGLEK